MNKILLVVASAIATMFVWISASFADGHCEKYADIRGKAWVDGDCMETPLGEKWWPHPIWGADDQAGSTNWYKSSIKMSYCFIKSLCYHSTK